MRNLQEELVKLVVRHRKAKSTNRTSLDLKFQSKSVLPLTIRTHSEPTIIQRNSYISKGSHLFMVYILNIKGQGVLVRQKRTKNNKVN